MDHDETNKKEMTELTYLNDLKTQLANQKKTFIHRLLFKKTNTQLIRKINRIEKSIKRQTELTNITKEINNNE